MKKQHMNTRTRPRINPPTTIREKWLDRITAALLLTTLSVTLFYYPQLPDKIPTHFDAGGVPDAWGAKVQLWYLVFGGFCMAVLLFFTYRIPHYYNLPVKITSENAAYEYQRARELMRMLNLGISLVLTIMVVVTCMTAIGSIDGFGLWFLPVFLLVLVGPVVYYFLNTKK